MKLLVDENIPLPIVTRLRSEGYEVEYVQRQVNDRIILEDAYWQNALLITLDKDFERLVLDEHRPTAGVLRIRIRSSIPIADRAQILVNVLRHRSKELWGTFTTLTETIVDIRRPIL
jgi:predicted nuclease of predicted toxin-antitoxin system